MSNKSDSKPVAWQWMRTGIFRKKIPARAAYPDHWRPLYAAPQPVRAELTDEQIWKFWWSRPEVPDGEDDSMEAEFIAAVRAVIAADHHLNGIGQDGSEE